VAVERQDRIMTAVIGAFIAVVAVLAVVSRLF
jgi:hypothetical protein